MTFHSPSSTCTRTGCSTHNRCVAPTKSGHPQNSQHPPRAPRRRTAATLLQPTSTCLAVLPRRPTPTCLAVLAGQPTPTCLAVLPRHPCILDGLAPGSKGTLLALPPGVVQRTLQPARAQQCSGLQLGPWQAPPNPGAVAQTQPGAPFWLPWQLQESCCCCCGCGGRGGQGWLCTLRHAASITRPMRRSPRPIKSSMADRMVLLKLTLTCASVQFGGGGPT